MQMPLRNAVFAFLGVYFHFPGPYHNTSTQTQLYNAVFALSSQVHITKYQPN